MLEQEETDYLLDMCELYDLRFIVIADRWDFAKGPQRTVEDLKERYYAIAAELTKARAGMELLASNQPLLRQPYDAQKERERKAYLAMALSRTPLQARSIPLQACRCSLRIALLATRCAACTFWLMPCLTLAMVARSSIPGRPVCSTEWA